MYGGGEGVDASGCFGTAPGCGPPLRRRASHEAEEGAAEPEAGGEEDLETASEKTPKNQDGNLILGTDNISTEKEKAQTSGKPGPTIKPSPTVKSTGNKSNTKARKSQGGGGKHADSQELHTLHEDVVMRQGLERADSFHGSGCSMAILVVWRLSVDNMDFERTSRLTCAV